jgi:hypothetical protein
MRGLQRAGASQNQGMRLAPSHIDLILRTSRELLGPDVRVTLFDSRADDPSRGGDVDLMVEVVQAVNEPAVLSARLASRI